MILSKAFLQTISVKVEADRHAYEIQQKYIKSKLVSMIDKQINKQVTSGGGGAGGEGAERTGSVNIRVVF